MTRKLIQAIDALSEQQQQLTMAMAQMKAQMAKIMSRDHSVPGKYDDQNLLDFDDNECGSAPVCADTVEDAEVDQHKIKSTKERYNRRKDITVCASAYRALFGEKAMPNDTDIDECHPIISTISQLVLKDGSHWLDLDRTDRNTQRKMTYRVILGTCPKLKKALKTRAFFRDMEQNKGLSKTRLLYWYFPRYLGNSGEKVVMDFRNRKDLESFGLVAVPSRKNNVILYVLDEEKFRKGLRDEYQITCLPGDKQWLKHEFARTAHFYSVSCMPSRKQRLRQAEHIQQVKQANRSNRKRRKYREAREK